MIDSVFFPRFSEYFSCNWIEWKSQKNKKKTTFGLSLVQRSARTRLSASRLPVPEAVAGPQKRIGCDVLAMSPPPKNPSPALDPSKRSDGGGIVPASIGGGGAATAVFLSLAQTHSLSRRRAILLALSLSGFSHFLIGFFAPSWSAFAKLLTKSLIKGPFFRGQMYPS